MLHDSRMYIKELEEMNETLNDICNEYRNLSKENAIISDYAQWHFRGLVYHTKNIIFQYGKIGDELQKRLNKIENPDVIIMYSPHTQNLMFEFYAFINLARISLDNLKHLLYPLFITPIKELPKSITDLGSGKTNCPVYERIAKTEELQYLIDLRNCLVHYKTLAVNDNSVFTKEGVDELNLESYKNWTAAMTKGVFRIHDKNKITFDIYLPDKIYDRSNNNKKLTEFTYNNSFNIVIATMSFIRHILLNYMDAFISNNFSQEKSFIYEKKGGIQPVFFLKIDSM